MASFTTLYSPVSSPRATVRLAALLYGLVQVILDRRLQLAPVGFGLESQDLSMGSVGCSSLLGISPLVHLGALYGGLVRDTQMAMTLLGPHTREDVLTCWRVSAAGDHCDLWSHILSQQTGVPT